MNDAAVQLIAFKIIFQHLKLLRRENINILAVARTVKTALGFDNPNLTANGNNVVGIEILLLFGVIGVNGEKVFVALVAVLIYPIHTVIVFAVFFKTCTPKKNKPRQRKDSRYTRYFSFPPVFSPFRNRQTDNSVEYGTAL